MAFNEERIAYQTIVIIELKRIFRIWSQTMLSPTVSSILYFIIFGQIIGAQVGTVSGYKYIQFIVPGLVMMNIITSSYSSAASAFFSAKFQHSIEELLVAPVPNITILLGYMSGGILRGVLVGIIVTFIALFFTHLHVHSIMTIIVTTLLSACIFALTGLINAIYAKNFEGISIIPTFVLTPLTYLGGVFYPITLLPRFWQHVSYVNPVSYIIDNFRFGFLGIKDNYLFLSYLLMISLIIILLSISYCLMEKGVGLRG